MAKELPYFKFFIGEWLKGDVTVCSMSTQGLFINLCVYYWGKEGDLTLKSVQHRFNTCSTELETLLDMGIISIDNENIVINFLDDQFSDFEILRKKKSRAGKASAKVRVGNKRSTPVQHNPNKGEKRREDKDKDKSKRFKLEILDFKEKYPTQLLEEFFNYWSEPNKSKTKLRYEMEKTWETSRRLSTWEKRSSGFKKEEIKGSNLSATPIPENFGVVNPNAITRQQYLEEKKLTENK